MENIAESRINRVISIVEKIGNTIITVSGILIGLSPFIALV